MNYQWYFNKPSQDCPSQGPIFPNKGPLLYNTAFLRKPLCAVRILGIAAHVELTPSFHSQAIKIKNIGLKLHVNCH